MTTVKTDLLKTKNIVVSTPANHVPDKTQVMKKRDIICNPWSQNIE